MKFCNGTTRQQSFGVAWGTVPQTPWDFSLFCCSSRRDGGRNGFLSKTAPALLLFAGSSRRSGRFPALPYPPLEQVGSVPRV
jgi:hypothetical protein